MEREEARPRAPQLIELIFEATVEAGDWPVYQHIDLEGHRRGIERPHEVLEALPGAWVSFDIPLDTASKVRLHVAGIAAFELGRELVQRFVNVVVALSERWEREPMLSPARAQPVVVQAHELSGVSEMGSETELRLIGLLLDNEGIGTVDWTEDPGSPFSVEIDFEIRDYRATSTVDDYLQTRRSDHS